MLRKLWRWLVGTSARCVIEIEVDGQRVRYEAPTVAEVRQLTGAVQLSPSDFVERP